MHIPYEEPQAWEAPAPSRSEGVWRFIRFSVVTGIIFAVSFLTINFGAYSQIASNILHPETRAEAERVLTRAGKSQIDPQKLLPVMAEKPESRKEFDWLDLPVLPSDDRIVIPAIGKSVPLVEMGTQSIEGGDWDELEKSIQEGLKGGVVIYPGTAKPGEKGNSFLTGHSSNYPWVRSEFNDTFALLGQLNKGDEFTVYYQGRAFDYRIYDKFEVNPDNVSVLQQNTDGRQVMTLMTCWPVGTALKRLIVKAELA